MTTAPDGLTASRASDSLRWRLPLVIAALIIVVVGLFLAVAFREVRINLTQAAGLRAQGAATRLATLLAQSTQLRVEELRRVAAHPAVREFLQHPNEATREAAQVHLNSLPAANAQLIELWSSSGEKLFSLATARNTFNGYSSIRLTTP